jgi:hypothetical protein
VKVRKNILVGGREMRRISILVMVLFISTSASAAVIIGVNGVMNPSEITLAPSDTASISVWTDAVLNTPTWYVLGIIEGDPGSLDGGGVWPQDPHILIYPPEPEPPILGLSSWIMFSYDGLTPLPPGMLLDGAVFHCDGPGNVIMRLYETDFITIMLDDTQMIHQTPEPATIVLLGLGAMLLKRRR